VTEPYEVDLTKPSRRALAEQLPIDVAVAASEFILGPLFVAFTEHCAEDDTCEA
jgi:hypothetical protein